MRATQGNYQSGVGNATPIAVCGEGMCAQVHIPDGDVLIMDIVTM